MNIRTRKSNHRSKVTLYSELDERSQPIGYFIPLLKEKKSSIRLNALKNLHNIFQFQVRDGETEMLDESLIEVLCGLFNSSKDKNELSLSASVLSLACMHIGPNQSIFKMIKGYLSTLITDGEEHHEVDTVVNALNALSLSCFFCCVDPDSYSHTMDLIVELFETQKKKLVLNAIMQSFLILSSKLDESKLVKYQELLSKFIELSKSSYPTLRLNSAIAMAFIINETKYHVDEDEEDDEDEDYDDYYDYDDSSEVVEEEEEEEEEEQEDEGSAGDQEDDEENEDSEEEEEEVDDEVDDHIITAIEDIFSNNNEPKGKKKYVIRNTLRQIVSTLESGDTPSETLTIDKQTFNFRGWRKYIQLQAIRKLLGNGLITQWLNSDNLRDILQVSIASDDVIRQQRRQFKNSLPGISKKRSQNLLKNRDQVASHLYAHNGDQ